MATKMTTNGKRLDKKKSYKKLLQIFRRPYPKKTHQVKKNNRK